MNQQELYSAMEGKANMLCYCIIAFGDEIDDSREQNGPQALLLEIRKMKVPCLLG